MLVSRREPTGRQRSLHDAAIDVHTHMLNRDWLELLRAHGRPRYEVRPSLDAPEGIFLDGAPFMTPSRGTSTTRTASGRWTRRASTWRSSP